jgi:hypothetical protein
VTLPVTAGSPAIGQWLDQDLDAWTRRVIARTFDPRSGSPYWVKRAAALPFEPLDITRYEQLTQFGEFPLDELRTLDPIELVPMAVPRPIAGRVWETGGTTGDPCRVFYTPPMLAHRAEWRRWSFVTEGFQPERVWLQATPTGPHLIGNGWWEVAEFHSGRVYGIDMDPRWVKRMLRASRLNDANEYVEHLLDQMCTVLQSQPVDYVNTTPALFQALVRRAPDLVGRLAGVRLSGTQINGTMLRTFLAALNGGLCGISYGNTFGNAASLPPEDNGQTLPYVPNYPQVTMAVVAKSDWRRTVEYGEVGRVRLTVLHDDLFLPNVLERDQAVRHDPAGAWPSDGVANVRPLQVVSTAPEGIY